MKALHFAKPLEFRLETEAEELTQGQTFAGTLSATNRGAEKLSALDICVELAYGEYKTLKAEGLAALTTVERVPLAESLELAPNDDHSADWSFTLASDCPITTPSGGLFLLYGEKPEDADSRGRIDLQVRLDPVLETLITTIENQFHFESATRKNVDDTVEVRFKPPESYATLRELYVRMQLTPDELELNFRFRIKALSRGPEKGLQTRTENIFSSLTTSEFLIGNKHPNRAALKEAVSSALREALPTMDH